jgi:hypothetical protein
MPPAQLLGIHITHTSTLVPQVPQVEDIVIAPQQPLQPDHVVAWASILEGEDESIDRLSSNASTLRMF